ncbi:T-cell surface antigen CD2 isoform X2 [Rhinatrema bivittatum]|uniref:T-cell surface antigen CD2 isoform X2 n=1 Tax=Rhinatrema bivittatum TaxID=194408 RepID=UPI0011279AC0|nr:T-cell surface antigen CD2 isoform X2 [Rhinatrema bivittatum]
MRKSLKKSLAMKCHIRLLTKFLAVSLWLLTGATDQANTVYGELNGTVLLGFSDKFESISSVEWRSSNIRIGKLQSSEVSCGISNEPRCQIFANGTLWIHRLMKEDERAYTVDIYANNGKHLKEYKFHVVVLEPLSAPRINWTCRTSDIRLWCAVDFDPRDKPEMNLFLKDDLLSRPATQIGNSAMNMTKSVSKTSSGMSFKCVVQNKFGAKSTQTNIQCTSKAAVTEFDLILILSVAGGAILFVIFLSLLIYCLRRRKQPKCNPEEEAELSTMKPAPRRSHRQLPEPPRQLPEPPVEPLDQPQREKQPKPRRQIKQHEQRRPPVQKPQPLPPQRGPQKQRDPRPRPRAQQKPLDYYVEQN